MGGVSHRHPLPRCNLISRRARALPTLLSTSPPPVVQVYLPNEEHLSYGVVRTYVKDYDDEPVTMGAATWLDSGGPAGWLACAPSRRVVADVCAGRGQG